MEGAMEVKPGIASECVGLSILNERVERSIQRAIVSPIKYETKEHGQRDCAVISKPSLPTTQLHHHIYSREVRLSTVNRLKAVNWGTQQQF
jgi:hypothetical protein